MPIPSKLHIPPQQLGEGKYTLRVDLVDVRQPLGKNIARHLVAIFVSELCRLRATSSDGSASIRDGSGHYAADIWREVEDVGDGGGVEELVLRQISRWVVVGGVGGSSGRRTGTFFCEITTAQSFPRRPIEVMLAAVMALKAYSVLPISSFPPPHSSEH
jgi:hypothetical protein